MKIWTEPKVTLLASTKASSLKPYAASTGSSQDWVCEFAGRACYQSFDNPSGKSNKEYLANILRQRHGSVLEHASATFYIEGVSRSLTHELVRHRAGFAYSQLSQRYVDESEVGFVRPPDLPYEFWRTFEEECDAALVSYRDWLAELSSRVPKGLSETDARKWVRQQARSVLPNATETKIVVTANMRAWRHFLEQRGSAGADAEIRRLATVLAVELQTMAPSIFQDMTVTEYVTFANSKV